MTTTMDAWKLSQLDSLLTASNWGKEWTLDEVSLVADTLDEKVADVAEVLERTVYAVSNLRGKLLEGWQPTNGRSRRKPLAEVRVCTTCWMEVPVSGVCC